MMRRLRCLFGGCLLVFAGVLAWLWFYQLAPVRKLANWQLRDELSPTGEWRLVQQALKRTGFGGRHAITYVSCLSLYGDEQWVEWSIKALASGVDDSYEGGHGLCDALRTMTNQDVGDEPGNWVRWWEKNRHKTQCQWIVDGLMQEGVKVDLPLDQDEIKNLLRFTASDHPDGRASLRLSYNVGRLLRDSGFELQQVRDLAPNVGGDSLLVSGLVRYAGFLAKFPRFLAPGMVIGQPAELDEYYETVLARPGANVTVCIILVVFVWAGVAIALRTSRDMMVELATNAGNVSTLEIQRRVSVMQRILTRRFITIGFMMIWLCVLWCHGTTRWLESKLPLAVSRCVGSDFNVVADVTVLITIQLSVLTTLVLFRIGITTYWKWERGNTPATWRRLRVVLFSVALLCWLLASFCSPALYPLRSIIGMCYDHWVLGVPVNAL